jgi:autotransporter passenger strand-loop-strand repeat protein
MGKTIGPGQMPVIYGIDFGSTIYSGGMEFVFGNAIDTVVNFGGSQFILTGGKAVDATVNAGGLQSVLDGGEAFETTVNSGGLQVVGYNGKADYATINHGSQYLKGVSYFSNLINGGIETVAGFGHAYETTVDAGSLQDVQQAGYVTLADIKNNGKQIVEGFGYADYTNVRAGGVEVVELQGSADHTTVAVGGLQDSFGWTHDASVFGLQKIENGAVDNWADIFAGGVQEIFEGGYAYGAFVRKGAAQFVSGKADHTQLDGYLGVWQDGQSVSTVVSDGGIETVAGTALSTTIAPNGQMVIEAGGVGNHTTIEFLGKERVLSGGLERDAIFDLGGTLDLDSANCVGMIEGWQVGAKVDLRDTAFGANTSFGYDNATGTFLITDGQHFSFLHLLGQYTASNFSLSSDGHGGTLISNPVGTA